MSGSGVSSSSLPPVSAGGSNFSTAGSGVGGTAAAAAAAAVLEAVNPGPRYPSTAQGPGPPYGNPQDMMMGSKGSDNMPASGMSPMQLGSMLGPNVQTGLYCESVTRFPVETGDLTGNALELLTCFFRIDNNQQP